MVTDEMVIAGVREAVKQKLLPVAAPMDIYTQHYESIRSILVAADKKRSYVLSESADHE